MPNVYGEQRGAERAVAATYRMTRAEKERLRREAAERGLTAQQLFELRMLGATKPVGRSGRTPTPLQEELPLNV